MEGCLTAESDRLSGYYLGFPHTHKFGMSGQTLMPPKSALVRWAGVWDEEK